MQLYHDWLQICARLVLTRPGWSLMLAAWDCLNIWMLSGLSGSRYGANMAAFCFLMYGLGAAAVDFSQRRSFWREQVAAAPAASKHMVKHK